MCSVTRCNQPAYGKLMYCTTHRNQYGSGTPIHAQPRTQHIQGTHARNSSRAGLQKKAREKEAQRIANQTAAAAIAALSGGSGKTAPRQQQPQPQPQHGRSLSQQQLQQRTMHEKFKKRMKNRCMLYCCVLQLVLVCWVRVSC